MFGRAEAQVTQDFAVDLRVATAQTSPVITLSWTQRLQANITAQNIYRRLKGATTWNLLSALTTTQTSYADTTAVVGTEYEYWMERRLSISPGIAMGYISAGVDVPAIEARGRMLLVIDNTMSGPLAPERDQLIQDLTGDGWTVQPLFATRTATAADVKGQISGAYASPTPAKALYLLGHVPVPYSGDLAPDGHGNHVGAWPADGYYGDIDGTWTDNSVNDSSSGDSRNWNTPGDGKFDQTSLPSDLELQVGRVDLSNMTLAPDTSVSETALLRRYLRKAHDYRHRLGSYVNIPRRSMLRDGFGYFGGESFASSGWATAFSCVGTKVDTPATDQWFNQAATTTYLWGYGNGGGSYTSASSVGTTTDFGHRSSRVVFTALFGSYFGDWDATNDFMRSVLAGNAQGDSLGLCCFWSGRPQWFMHPCGLGETIGYAARLTLNNTGTTSQYQFPGYSTHSVHEGLMGDPSLRFHMVEPPRDLRAKSAGAQVQLAWASSTEPTLLGYHVYRGTSSNGPYTRLNASLLSATTYTDTTAVAGTAYFYMVRTLKTETAPGGTYQNLSQGSFVKITANASANAAPFNPGGLAVQGLGASGNVLTWIDNSSDETGFRIERRTNVAQTYASIGTVGADIATFTDPGPFTNGTVYYYRVIATSANGDSPPSTEVSVDGGARVLATLTSPAAFSAIKGSVNVSFNLPEAVTAGSVMLGFDDGVTPRLLTLASSQETIGAHSFSFNPANPTGSPEIASGGAIPDGIHTVTLFYQDTSTTPVALSSAPAGHVAIDNVSPTLSLPANITAEATGPSGATVSFSVSATDAVDGARPTAPDHASGSTFPVATTTVNVGSFDSRGNYGTAAFTVTVQDTIAPVVAAHADVTVEATSPAGAVVSYAAGSATDAVTTSPIITYSKNSGTTFPIGMTTVTISAKDAANNTGTGTFTVTVQDTTAPVVAAHANVTVEATSAAGAVVNYAAASASDAVTTAPTITYSQNSGTTFPIGSTIVNITAKDAANNTGTGSFTVTVQDTTGPVVSVPATITAEATSAAGAVVSFSVSATDAVDGPRTATPDHASGSTFPLGTTPVSVSATDSRGNPGQATFNVVVQDTTAPLVAAHANVTVEATSAAGAVVNYAAGSATDAVTASPTITYSQDSGTTFPVGMTTVTISAKDAANNTGTATFTVTVQDTTAPVVAAHANVIAEATSAAGAVVNYAAGSAIDAVTATPMLTYSQNAGTTFPLGTTTVTINATDAANNTGSTTFTVTVQDTTAPVVAAHANVTAEATSAAGAVVNYAAGSAVDAVTAAPTITYSQGSGTTFPLGPTTVTISARDAANNLGTGTFTVTVQDTTAPAITVPADITVEATSAAGAVVSFSVSAEDLVDGSVMATPDHASGSTFALGTTTVNVSATDSRMNTGNQSFTVTVRDTTAPVVTPPANVTVEATSASGANVTFGNATATDAVGVASVTYAPANGSLFPLGSTTVTVTAKDAAEHTGTATFTVLVQDTIAPTIDPPAGGFTPLVLHAAQGGTVALPDYATQAVMNDAVGVATRTQSPPAGTPVGEGTHHVTLTASDAATHSTEAGLDVTVLVSGTAALAAKGNPVPGAGTDPRIPAGATWGTFGVPSIAAGGRLTGWLANVLTPAVAPSQLVPRGLRAGSFAGIFATVQDTPTLLLRTDDAAHDANGDPLVGVTFKSFREPVFAGQQVAVIATVKGATPATDTGIWLGDTSGALRAIVREGDLAPGTSVKFKSFTSLAMPSAGTVFFTATLMAPGTKDAGLWVWTQAGGLQLALREGDPIAAAGGALLKSFVALSSVNGSPGHARYDAATPLLDLRLSFADPGKTVAIGTVAAESSVILTQRSGQPNPDGRVPANYGVPSSPGHGAGVTVLTTFAPDATHKATQAIYDFELGEACALQGQTAPGADPATFKSFLDPVAGYGFDGNRVQLFAAKLMGSAPTGDTGLWAYTSSLGLVAREGGEPPGAAGTKWKSFTSFSVLEGRGPMFTAKLASGTTKVTTKDDVGLWATDSTGTLRLILREGDPVPGGTLKSFTVLGAVAGSPGQRRAWASGDASARVVYLGFLTDGSSAILSTTIP